MVLGSKGVCYINFGSFCSCQTQTFFLPFFLQGLAEAMKIASQQDDLHEEIMEATTVLCKQGAFCFFNVYDNRMYWLFFMYVM